MRFSTALPEIKSIRARTGLSQKAFSELTGVPQRTIENWETGKRIPPEYVVNLLAFYVDHLSAPK